ncbi:polyprenyl synthetase family protein [Streptomyces sp. NPDC051577]|uniref:polyprenyl synthetase family protein n=1 Tax=Streptomyces sp. NPDC051577 TaxID=3155166 RepID=UPI0034441998
MNELAVLRQDTAAHPSPAEVRTAVEAEIATRWPDDAAGLDAIHHYALKPSRKLLRPLLLCHSALIFPASLPQVLPAAIGFEAVHTGSLLHDDILDNDPMRRGRPAVHAVYGVEQAIVAGNSLFFAWFAGLAECSERGISDDRIRQAMAVQARAGMEVCRGAAEELTLAGNFDSGIPAYLSMARRKTAVMLAAACQVGGILAGATPHEQEKLADFGEQLGLAFQIRDDLLPYGDAAGVSGKPGDSDLRNHRPTLPILLALDLAEGTDQRALRHLLALKTYTPGSQVDLGALLARSGALDEARQIAHRHARAAADSLAWLPPGPHLDAMTQLSR